MEAGALRWSWVHSPGGACEGGSMAGCSLGDETQMVQLLLQTIAMRCDVSARRRQLLLCCICKIHVVSLAVLLPLGRHQCRRAMRVLECCCLVTIASRQLLLLAE